MIPLEVKFVPNDGKTQAWPELDDNDPNVQVTSIPPKIAIIEGGTQSGRASVALRIDSLDGRSTIICQTSARLFVTAAKAILARYPGLMDD